MGLSIGISWEAGSFSHHCNPHRFYQSEVLKLHFLMLEPWVVRSIWLPSCSSWSILTQIWDHPLHQPVPHLVSQVLPCLPQSSSHCLAISPLYSGCLSPPILPVWMNVSSLTPWLSDFYIILFSGSSGYLFLFKLVVVLLLIV